MNTTPTNHTDSDVSTDAADAPAQPAELEPPALGSTESTYPIDWPPMKVNPAGGRYAYRLSEDPRHPWTLFASDPRNMGNRLSIGYLSDEQIAGAEWLDAAVVVARNPPHVTRSFAQTLAAYRAGTLHCTDFQAVMAGMEVRARPRCLAELGVDEVESLLEVAFLCGDTVYRDRSSTGSPTSHRNAWQGLGWRRAIATSARPHPLSNQPVGRLDHERAR